MRQQGHGHWLVPVPPPKRKAWRQTMTTTDLLLAYIVRDESGLVTCDLRSPSPAHPRTGEYKHRLFDSCIDPKPAGVTMSAERVCPECSGDGNDFDRANQCDPRCDGSHELVRSGVALAFCPQGPEPCPACNGYGRQVARIVWEAK